MKRCGLNLPRRITKKYIPIPINDGDSIRFDRNGNVHFNLDYTVKEKTVKEIYVPARFMKACRHCRHLALRNGRAYCKKEEQTFSRRFYG